VSTLHDLITSSRAFAKPANIIQTIPFDKVTLRPTNAPHSLYEELHHIDYWQSVSLAIVRGEKPPMPLHNSESFPEKNEVSEKAWQALVAKVLGDLKTAADLAKNEEALAYVIRSGLTARDELTVLAAHNAYHFGRMVLLRQLSGIWSSELGDTW
jgi:DinB superfamily